MANTIKIKAGSGTPTTSDIVDRELAFDTSADILYIRDSNDIVAIGGSASGAVTSVANFSDNRLVTASGSTTLNGESNLTFDGTHLRVPDSSKFIAGAGDDLQMYHDGTNNIIKNNISDQDFYIKVNDGGSSINALRIDASGIGKVMLPNDSQKLSLGAGDDFQLWHDGTNSYINNSTGHIYFTTEADDKNLVFRSDDGSGGVANYYVVDGANSINKFYKHIRLPVDSQYISVGAGNDLAMTHDGTNSYIDNGTGMLFIRNTLSNQDIRFTVNDGGSTTNLMTLNSASSRVGIMTTSPQDHLHVYGTSGTTQVRIETTADAGAQIRYKNDAQSWINGINLNNQYAWYSSELSATVGMFHVDGYFYSYKGIRLSTNNIPLQARDAAGNLANLMTLDTGDILRFGDTDHIEQIAISTASTTNQMILSSSGISMTGNVTMSSPLTVNYGATINEGGNDSDFRVESQGNTSMLRVDASTNRVGIGTGSPSSPLNVKSNSTSSSDSGITITQTGGSNAIFKMGEKSTDGGRFHMYDGGAEKIAFYTDGTANHISAGRVGIGTNSPDSMLEVQFGNAALGFAQGIQVQTNPSDYTNGRGGGIEFKNADVQTAGVYGVRISGWGSGLAFYTHSSSSGNTFGTTYLERMRINQGGYVGIGTNSPSYNLHVKSASGSHAEVRIETPDQTSGSVPALSFNNGDRIYSLGVMTDESFSIRDGSDSWATRLAITTAGLVGISTNSPLATLDLGSAGGEKFYVYCNGASIRNGLGIDMSGTSRELSYFHSSSNASDGQHSWGYRLESNGSYVERMQLTGAGHLTLNAGGQYIGDSTSGVLSTGSWYGDLSSNGFERVAGLSHDGGEFVIVEKGGRVSTLVDGNYFAYESGNGTGGGFFSSTSSSYANAPGIRASAASELYVVQWDDGAADLTVSGMIKANGTGGFTIGNVAGAARIQEASNEFSFLTTGNAYANIYTDDITAAGKIIHYGDTDTYLNFSAADTWKVYCGGHNPLTTIAHRVYINASGANGLLINNDESNAADSARIFFEGTSTSTIFQAGSRLSFRSGATTGSSSGTERVYIDADKMMITGAGVNTFRIQFPNDQRIYDNGGGGLRVGAAAHALELYGGSSTDRITFINGGISGSETARITPTGLELANTKKLVLDGAGGNTYINQNSGSSSRLDFVVNGTGVIDLYNTHLKVNKHIEAGDNSDTNGVVALAVRLAGDDLYNVWGSQYSSGKMMMGNSVKPRTGAEGFISSHDNSASTKEAVTMGAGLWQYYTAASATTTTGDVVSMTERVRFDISGNGHFDADVVAYSSTVSDERLKDNIQTIPNALDKVMQLRGVEFDWNATSRKGQHDLGVVAQEVEKVLPELVKEKTLCTGEFTDNEKEFKTVDYDKIVAVLIEAVKQQQEEIELLKANYDDLKYNRR